MWKSFGRKVRIVGNSISVIDRVQRLERKKQALLASLRFETFLKGNVPRCL